MATQQQTVLRVQFDNVNTNTGITEYEFLDLYGDIPIKISKSFAELQDISKRNSDYSIGLQLPGSKRNNRFFENFFDVDAQSLYFNATKRVSCQVLLNDEPYFTGYMRLNRTSVMESKIEYDVTLYSSIGDLFGNIGNHLLNELDFNDIEYRFNHQFDQYAVTNPFDQSIFSFDTKYPIPYFYPIVHNGYEYSGDTVNLSGATTQEQTRLYTTTGPISGYTSQAAAWAAGVKQYRINSPGQGIIDNQLKPALNIYSLIQLIFKTYGYTISSDFFNTPWFKSLYMYGYFSSDRTKFGYNLSSIATLPLEGVEIVFVSLGGSDYAYVCKLGTGIPCFCASDINVVFQYDDYPYGIVDYPLTIPAGTTGTTSNYGATFVGGYSSQVSNGTRLAYLPVPVGTFISFQDGDNVDFSIVISDTIKQIDLLSSIAKKFNLVFVPDPYNKNQIIIEPYNFYIGTGDIYDWSDKISWDKGFTVEPALNYIESQLTLTDQEDGDYGNQEFKSRNNRIYGQNIVYNPTDFKSQEKKIDTIFSPELIRTWDDNISLPLGINYAGSSQTVNNGGSESLAYIYKGLKTKPKLMFWLGGFNPFLNIVGEAYPYGGASVWPTYNIWVANSDASLVGRFEYIPIISHTMPMGNPDSNKINNDSLCNLFNSEEPVSIGTTTAYNTYTQNDIYSVFYQNRIDNLYDPNTRFLSGYFNLKYNDIKNLKANDLIKINEQYFTWNKIDGFNLTNPELSKVELIQSNNNPSEYPTRYFAYYYCQDPTTCFKFKTDFTNPNLRDTNYFWSVLYDYYIGILGGNVSGFTSSFAEIQNYVIKYIPYFMYEISKDDYDTSTCLSWDCDTLHDFIYNESLYSFSYHIPGFWFSSGINDLPPAANTKQGLNVYSGCTEFYAAATLYGITTGSSIYHGSNGCPTPTPTPTVTSSATPTPTPSPTITITPSNTPTNTITPSITPTNTITPSVTPTHTVTPSITPSITPTMTITASPLACVQYSVTNSGGSPSTIQYTDCNGIVQTTTSSPGTTIIIGALIGLIACIAGDCFSTQINYIPTPTPTPTNTMTPTVTPSSNTPTPTTTPTPTRTPGYLPSYFMLASSATGGTINKSLDGGLSWTTLTGTPSCDNFRQIAMDEDGQYVLAAAKDVSSDMGFLYLSSNSGTTWTSKLSKRSWQNLSISATGQYMYACGWDDSVSPVDYYIYRSTNYGSSFTQINVTSLGLTSKSIIRDVQVSPDGQYVIFSYENPSGNDILFLSSDYGATFGGIYSASVIQGCSVSQYCGLLTVYGQTPTGLKTSTDGGLNWIIQSGGTLGNVHPNYNGQYQLSGKGSASTITTNSWSTSIAGPTGVNSFVNYISAQGDFMVFVRYSGGSIGIYISNNYGTTWTNRKPFGTTGIVQAAACAKFPWQ
jgi:hypothetical protein